MAALASPVVGAPVATRCQVCATKIVVPGPDEIAWSDTNNGGFTRSFTSFSDAIDDVVDARVWSGIHFRNADEQGARIGRQVAGWRERHYFKPVHGD